jgi:hypothetical protein
VWRQGAGKRGKRENEVRNRQREREKLIREKGRQEKVERKVCGVSIHDMVYPHCFVSGWHFVQRRDPAPHFIVSAVLLRAAS